MTQIPIQCEQCSAPVKFIPAGISRNTGKHYNEFYSCAKRCGWTWREGKETKPVAEPQTTKDMIIIEKLDEINDRLDKLAIYLKEKLEL